MQISNYKAVILDYIARDDSGEVIDSAAANGPIRYIHGTEDLIPGLEQALEGHSQGERLQVDVPMDLAYGPRDESLVEEVPRANNFPGIDVIEPGMRFETRMDDGSPMLVTVIAADRKRVTVDGNYPLAGKNLHFELEVLEVREATSEELEHGLVHDEAGTHALH
ncbi:MAG: peptidylprolyl isomerase [Candidatus Sedimenticola endophacoides]